MRRLVVGALLSVGCQFSPSSVEALDGGADAPVADAPVADAPMSDAPRPDAPTDANLPPDAAVDLTLAMATTSSLLIDECSTATAVSIRSDGVPTPRGVSVAVTLAASPAGSLHFYSDATCSTLLAADQVTIGATESTTVFYYTGRTASGSAPHVITASATGYADAAQDAVIRPLVQSGSGSIGPGATASVTLAHPVDLSRTFLLYQATSAQAKDKDSNTRCGLSDSATVTCARVAGGGTVTFRYQAVSVPRGLSVQHFPVVACTGATTTQAVLPVDLSHSFVLLGSREDGSDAQDGEDYETGELTSTTTVSIGINATSCAATHESALQVVTWDDVEVSRGVVSGMAAGAATTTAGAASTATSVLLYSLQAGASADVCENVARGAISDATTLSFVRGCSTSTSGKIAWELLGFAAAYGVSTHLVSLPDAAASSAAPITSSFRNERTFVIVGGQGVGGQSFGQAAGAGGVMGIGAAVADPGSDATVALTLTRGKTDGDSSFTVFLVEIPLETP